MIRTPTLDDGCTDCRRRLYTDSEWARLTAEEKIGAARHAGHGRCKRCYRSNRQHLQPKCAVDSCRKPRWARRWCARHYQRWRRTGSTDGGWKPKPIPEPLDAATVAALRRQVGLPTTLETVGVAS